MKYIIFDFDGTIGDSQSLIVKTLQDTMRARKLEVKSDEACAKTSVFDWMRPSFRSSE